MGKVVKLPVRKTVPPKTINDTHAGQRYTVTFDPNAPPHEQWVWVVEFVRTYRIIGAGPTAEAASVKARRRIHAMIKRQQVEEESE